MASTSAVCYASRESRLHGHHDRLGAEGSVMSVPYKPETYTSAAPYLVVDGAARTIDFLERVFGAERLRRYDLPSGKVLHAEVRLDDTVIMLADPPPNRQPTPAYVHVYVQDVDAIYRRALDAGATSVQEPVKKDDADKRGGVKDPGGTTWWIATQVE
jgi:uncharacterized glyoxalase superfamily protein PhnB